MEHKLPMNPQEGTNPSDTLTLTSNLQSWETEYISDVLSHPVCHILL